jgi:NADH-quinone oxidoreductase subunit G
VLGSLLGIEGFEFDVIDDVRAACLGGKDVGALLSNRINMQPDGGRAAASGIQRIADVPIYFADPIVRRSPPLQKTPHAKPPKACMNASLAQRLGVAAGQPVLVRQGNGEARLMAEIDAKLPDDCVRISAAHPSTAALGPMFGTLEVGKLAVGKAA